MPQMRMTAIQRRRAGLILFAVGSLPLVLTAEMIASAFMLPSLFNGVFDLFVPPGVDAPDNWAVAITRMARLFSVSGIIGFLLSGVGFWLWRTAA